MSFRHHCYYQLIATPSQQSPESAYSFEQRSWSAIHIETTQGTRLVVHWL